MDADANTQACAVKGDGPNFWQLQIHSVHGLANFTRTGGMCQSTYIQDAMQKESTCTNTCTQAPATINVASGCAHTTSAILVEALGLTNVVRMT